ncbi:MAG: pyruvoyl-dependent arginine decarboxylase [Flavisolibacter sp.]
MLGMTLIPKKFFLTKGTGIHEKDLRAFENAMIDAGIDVCNLIKTSSVIPAGCQLISKEEGMKLITPGQITFAIVAQTQTNEPGQIISAGIAYAQPEDESLFGYMTEVEEAIGRTKEDVAEDVEEMVIETLISKWGIKKDGEQIMKRGKKNYEIKNKKFKVDSFVETAKGNEDRLYTVVLVCAIFIL